MKIIFPQLPRFPLFIWKKSKNKNKNFNTPQPEINLELIEKLIRNIECLDWISDSQFKKEMIETSKIVIKQFVLKQIPELQSGSLEEIVSKEKNNVINKLRMNNHMVLELNYDNQLHINELAKQTIHKTIWLSFQRLVQRKQVTEWTKDELFDVLDYICMGFDIINITNYDSLTEKEILNLSINGRYAKLKKKYSVIKCLKMVM